MSQANVDSVIISNGEDFFEIPVEDLSDALNDGFYQPRDRGLTIVSNGEEVFEIPVEDAAEALQEGFRDLIASPDGSLPAPPPVESSSADTSSSVSVSADNVQNAATAADSTVVEPEHADGIAASGLIDSAADESPGGGPKRGGPKSDELRSDVAPPESVTDSQSATVAVHSDVTDKSNQDDAAITEHDSVSGEVGDPGEVVVEEPEDVEAEHRRQLEEEMEAAQGFDKLKLFVLLHVPTRRGIDRFMRSYGASTLLHVVLVVVLWNIVYSAPDKLATHVISSVLGDSDLEAEEEGPPVEVELPDSSMEASDDVSEMQEMMAVTQLAAVDLSPESLKIDLTLGAGEAAAAEEAKGGGMTSSGAATKGALGARSKAISMYGGTPSSEAAVEAALDWLARHQAPDGSWCFNHSLASPCACPNTGTSDGRTGATGVALLTYFGAGYTYADGPRAPVIRKGLQFLLQSMNVNSAGYGDLKGGDTGHGGIYQHGLAAAAMCEALAVNRVLVRMVRSDRSVKFIDPSGKQVTLSDLTKLGNVLRNASQLAINYIVYHQDAKAGGWGYTPKSAGDTSILGWQVMALISARSEKLATPAATWNGISNYLNTVAAGSGYAYRPAGAPKASTSAIGVLCRMYTGAQRSDPRLKTNINYLTGEGPSRGDMYYNYYATQAMFAWGDEKGDGGLKLWTQWNDKMRDMLVASQGKTGHSKGSWNSGGHAQGGRHFDTCLSAMTLEIYYRKLPVYQRLSLEPIELK